MSSEKILKVCSKGHKFYKSSSCPTCPICEKERKPQDGFLSAFSAPARRALENAGIKNVKQLSKFSEKEILALHGMGKASLPALQRALKAGKLSFREISGEKITKPSEPEKVDAFMKKLKHPLKEVAVELRKIILSVDKNVGEEIFWNAPTFFYTGKMKPFQPKEYKRCIVVFNFFRKDCIRLIFLTGAKVNDKTGFLQGNYADGRRLAFFTDMKDVKAKEKILRSVIKKWLALLEK